MRKAQLQGTILVLILLVTFIGLYFIYKGAGLATAYGIEVIIEDGAAKPSEVYLERVGYIMVTNQDSVRQEVEVLKGNKVVLRRHLREGQSYLLRNLRHGSYNINVLTGEEEPKQEEPEEESEQEENIPEEEILVDEDEQGAIVSEAED